jgi:hypothetical protein
MHPVGYDWLWRETPPPVSDKDPSVGARAAARSRRFGVGAFLRMTVIGHNHCFADSV